MIHDLDGKCRGLRGKGAKGAKVAKAVCFSHTSGSHQSIQICDYAGVPKHKDLPPRPSGRCNGVAVACQRESRSCNKPQWPLRF